MNMTYSFLQSQLGTTIIGEVIATSMLAFFTAIIAFFFTKRYSKQVKLAKKLKNHNIDEIDVGQISLKDIKFIFKKAEKIQIIYVAGGGFVEANSNFFQIAQRRKKRGDRINIQFLYAQKGSSFLQEIQEMEIIAGIRAEEKEINQDIDRVINLLQPFSDLIESRCFSTQYRLPVIIASFRTKSKNGVEKLITRVWMQVTLPPDHSDLCVILKGTRVKQYDSKYDYFESDDEESVSPSIVEMAENYFETIWKLSKKSR
ncbi:hypothetical protein [Sporolactobacillus spathodeae]|uniref:Phosphate/sulfate permease n=1 Tax=Sporolactobacillus spathodeae TaxID=1465502 RepID=A0ABS2Q7L6_9BACL|nr:hypothetical protein [Sporolactobacillus spathodeae]MBM7657772.1 phosphate/sulfate permease [Sporolactobacillus spathodeae]